VVMPHVVLHEWHNTHTAGNMMSKGVALREPASSVLHVKPDLLIRRVAR
jgi:hypothetical protein